MPEFNISKVVLVRVGAGGGQLPQHFYLLKIHLKKTKSGL